MYKYKYTIYTPCYNSGKYIDRVFRSLEKQTFRDFELIIINDGSKDDSEKFISELINTASFPINFINLKENIGFNKSMNLAVAKAQGEYFLIAHSDDEFVYNSLEVMLKYWEKIDNNEKVNLQGVKCNCIDQNGHFLGDHYPHSPWISDMFELVYKYKIRGEKWGFIKTDILKEFPFPEEVKFVPEALIWFRINYKYKSVFINEDLRIYYTDGNPNSLLTQAANKSNFCVAKRITEKVFINSFDKKLIKFPVEFLKIFIRYIGYSVLSGLKISVILKDIKKIKYRILILILYPLGVMYAKL